MTGGLGPEELGEATLHGAGAGLLVAAVGVMVLLAIWAAAEAWHIETRRRTRAATQERAQAAVRAQQLDAGTQAGWHDAGPADRRRTR